MRRKFSKYLLNAKNQPVVTKCINNKLILIRIDSRINQWEEGSSEANITSLIFLGKDYSPAHF